MIAYQAGNIGTRLLFEIKNQAHAIVDISDAAGVVTRRLIMKTKSGQMRTGTLLLETDGTDGQCYYETLAGDLEAGTLVVQAQIVWDSGRSLRTNRLGLPVQPNLDDPLV